MTLKVVEKAVYELLKGLANGQVYVVIAPQNVSGDFITFHRVDSDRIRSINGPSGLSEVYIRVDCYSETYYGMKALASQAEEILDGYKGSVPYGDDSPQDIIKIGGISLQNDVDLLEQTQEPFLHRNTASYYIIYNNKD